MKNLKTKILLLMGTALILIVENMCLAAKDPCFHGHNFLLVNQHHSDSGLVSVYLCGNDGCGERYTETDDTHKLQTRYVKVNDNIHNIIITCSNCSHRGDVRGEEHEDKIRYANYDNKSHKKIHYCKCGYSWEGIYAHDTKGKNGACSVCGYKQTTTAPTVEECPGSSSGKHMWGTPSYSREDAGNHNRTVTCMMCNEKSVLTQPHTLPASTKYSKDDSNHWKTGVCTQCGEKITVNKAAHSYGDSKYSRIDNDTHREIKECEVCDMEKTIAVSKHVKPKGYIPFSHDTQEHWKVGKCTSCDSDFYVEEKQAHILETPKVWEHVLKADGYYHYRLGGKCKICYCTDAFYVSQTRCTYENGKCTECGMKQTDDAILKEKINTLKSISIEGGTSKTCVDGNVVLGTIKTNPPDFEIDNVKWSSSDSIVLSIENNKKAKLGGITGTVTLTATLYGKTANCSVKVVKHEYGTDGKCEYCGKTKLVSTEDNTEKEAIIPTSIKFGRKETTICLGCTPTAFSLVNGYTFKPTGVTEKGLVWTTNNSFVLNVSGTTITPKKIGKATLTAKSTAANSVSETCTVNIVAHKLKEEIKTDYDKNNHWTVGRCGYCGKTPKFNIQAHTFENDKCKYCPATKSSNTCVHEIDETTATFQYDANKHWQNGKCLFCGKVLDDTDKYAAKSHTYGTALDWKTDATYHWKEFSCTKCKYVKKEHAAKHTISAGSWEWKYNSRGESMHYKMGKCTKCKKTDLYAVRPTLCSYENGKCTVCNRKQSDETAVTEPVLQKISIVGGTNKTCVLGNIKLGDIKAEPPEAKIGNITWSSSNTSIIVIQNENYAMAVGTPGKSILTVKTETGITATYLVTVVNHEYDSNGKCKYCGNVKLTDKPLELTEPVEPAKEILPKEITFNRTSALLCLNHGNLKSKIECTMIAVPKILPENATNQDLTWSSSDSSILEINGACVVAKQKGKVTLTAKTSNGLTATCNIEVVDHKKAQEMEYDYNGTNHWKYGICGNSLEDIYNTNEEKHTFVNGVCKCGKRVSIVSGEDILAGYEDVKRSDWYQESVEYVTEKKLMNGMGDEKFNPNGSMTRGMLVTVLYRMSRSTYVGKSEFIDVSEFEYYSTAVAWATENEIVKGVGNNSFAPDDEVTREQLITILYRYAKYANRTVRVIKKSNISKFEDYIEISEYSLEAFEWGYVEKIISGRSTTTLNPKGTASRAEVATMLMRFEGEE